MARRLTWPWAALAAASLAACARPAASPTASPAASTREARGEALYADRCGRCHDLVAPEAYSRAQWAGVLSRMQPYAELTDDEMALIEAWLATHE